MRSIYITLLRGLNVGKTNRIKMAALKSILAPLALEQLTTYIQSGNLVFKSDIGAKERNTQIIETLASKNLNVKAMTLSLKDFAQALNNIPFAHWGLNVKSANPALIHLFFLSEEPASEQLAALKDIQTENESTQLIGKVLYLFAPDGIGRSKLVKNLEKKLLVQGTTRNLRSVLKIHALAEGLINEP